jgi:hypothetical protein
LAGWVLLRAGQRRRFLERVSQGREARWRIVDGIGGERADLPVLSTARSEGEGGKLLVRVRVRSREAGEPFRSPEFEEVAVVGTQQSSSRPR